MKALTLPVAELGLIVATRAMLAMGIGLLSADRMSPGNRRRIAAPLLAIGALTTLPLAWDVYRRIRSEPEPQRSSTLSTMP